LRFQQIIEITHLSLTKVLYRLSIVITLWVGLYKTGHRPSIFMTFWR